MEIWAVTVTYGNRYDLVKKIIQKVIDEGVDKVVIVNNCSTPDSTNKLIALQKAFTEKIILLHLEKNTGSAVGFKTGIKKAISDSNDKYLLLLDDDNLICDNLFNALKIKIEQGIILPHNLYAVLRETREPYKSVAQGYKVEDVFPDPDSFLSFDFAKIFKKKILRIKPVQRKNTEPTYTIPYAPYGGLFFHSKNINNIGLPNEKFILYSDDHEFTHRIYNFNGSIELLPDLKVSDIDESWNIKQSFVKKYFKADRNKVYLTVRNRTFFEKKYIVKNRLKYFTNKLFLLIIFSFYAILSINNFVALRLIYKALKDSKKLN